MIELVFTKEDLAAHFHERYLSRGRGYWRGGRVRELKVSDDGRHVTALVQGTRAKPYKTEIEIQLSENPRTHQTIVVLATDCSCPIGCKCKHAAAACLKALEL